MTVMIDTNIIFSAVLFPNGKTAQALLKALQPPYQPVISDYVIDELRQKVREKFPHRLMELESFLFNFLPAFKVVSTPEEDLEEEKMIRDTKDRPILRAALSAGTDLILSGDKDFLQSAIEYPQIVSVPDFLSM